MDIQSIKAIEEIIKNSKTVRGIWTNGEDCIYYYVPGDIDIYDRSEVGGKIKEYLPDWDDEHGGGTMIHDREFFDKDLGEGGILIGF